MRPMMLVVFAVMFGVACGYADPLSQSRYGGVLALTGDEREAMKEARRLMTTHCGPDNFEVVRIEEVVVDQEDYVVTENTYDGVTTEDETGEYESGREVTETHAGTHEMIEIHVTYRCFVPTPPPF